MTPGLFPVNNHALVELGGYYKNISVPEGKYDTHTNGLVVAVDADEKHAEAMAWVGHRVYFQQFTEGTRVERDGKLYTFIKLENIEGYE